jgi:ubiquinone biosynthesis monooxygenase Coq7
MKADEIKHAETAITHGGVPLPEPVKQAMQLTSKVLTFAAYRV